jgi:hypothetical protein
VLVGLRRQEPLNVLGHGLEREGIRVALDPSRRGVDALEHRGQRADLLTDEDTPLGVQGGVRHIITAVKGVGASKGHIDLLSGMSHYGDAMADSPAATRGLSSPPGFIVV